MNEIMYTKAKQAVVCYEDLQNKLDIHPEAHVEFLVDDHRKKQIERAMLENNPFPGVVKAVLLNLRRKSVARLFQEEKVLQTGPAAAILTLDAAMEQDIAGLRNPTDLSSTVVCDIAFAGLQVIRLYMMGYEGNKAFIDSRYQSALRVDNALNGSFYKYRTKDGRYFSAHVYYESQKKIMMETLNIPKKPEEFVFGSLLKDKKLTADAIKQWNGFDLEEKTFENGACGCVLRDREEWEATDVGKAVCAMPLYRFDKVSDAPKKDFGAYDPAKGPLSGVKVLDLTHIIAGPACTRLLAEAGADVLLVRRGSFVSQEQAMLELDGWAGKNSIQLDFNIPEQLERVKELIREADIVISSYQDGSLNRFGLSIDEIHAMNPNVIYGSLVCFSDTVWRDRPGWAPCAEDITGLSIRNGSRSKPVNLNGVPLDYIPGMILYSGILKALKKQMTEGGSYTVLGSLTRGGYWLHECTDEWENRDHRIQYLKQSDAKIIQNSGASSLNTSIWDSVTHKVRNTSVGDVYFPSPAAVSEENKEPRLHTMKFNDGQKGFKE